MKVALAQIAPRLGDLQHNIDLHEDIAAKSKEQDVDLLVFPELSLTGYTLKDLAAETAINPKNNSLFKKMLTLSQDLSMVFGFVEEGADGLVYNSSAFCSQGKILHIHRKVFLPTYGMFEEGKFFAQGKNFRTFESPLGKTGMMICYDFLHYGASYLLFAGGSGLNIIISAAPGRGVSGDQSFSTSAMWELMGQTISRFSSTFVIYCNRVGLEDGKVFAGGSFIYNPGGILIAQSPYVDEDLLLADIDMEEIKTFRKKWPYKRDDKPEIILEALKRVVKDYED